MKKNLFLPCLILLVLSCSTPAPSRIDEQDINPVPQNSSQPDKQDGYLISKPQDNSLIIIGVSNRRSKPAEELEIALDNAAWKAALYHGLKGKIETTLNTGTGFFDFYHNRTSDIFPFPGIDYNVYKEKLKYDSIKDVLRTESGVFVRFTYPVPDMRYVDYASGLVKGEPLWLHNRISEASGYMLAVGSSGRQRYIKETITKSYESAIAALLAQKSVNTKTKDIDSSQDGAVTELKEVIDGELSFFHILEIWIDPKTQAVYTLAAAKKE